MMCIIVPKGGGELSASCQQWLVLRQRLHRFLDTYDDRRKYRHEIDLPNERILEHIVAEGHRRPDRRS